LALCFGEAVNKSAIAAHKEANRPLLGGGGRCAGTLLTAACCTVAVSALGLTFTAASGIEVDSTS
jgi:hypothetical protein